MKYRLGIDLGGTSAKLALVNQNNRIVKDTSVGTGRNPKPARLARKLFEASNPLTKGKSISQVGVGVAGDIDFDRGLIRISPNLGWKKVPLKSLLKKYFRKNVIVDNDANAAAWGIYKTQAPRSVKNVIVATLGTGVGGGIILNGALHRGATGTAGEIGHMTMEFNGRACNCGAKGCLETYAGGWYIKRWVNKQLALGTRSQLQKIYRDNPKHITPHTIAKAALRGDRFAKSIWDQVGTYLGTALGDLIYVFNPEMIFLTGGVSQARGLILKPLWNALKTRTFRVPVGAVKIKVADNAAHVGVIGASLL